MGIAARAGLWAALVGGAAAAMAPRAAGGTIVEITAPADRQVVQRGADDAAWVAVRGRAEGPVAHVLVRARPRPGARGEAVPWRVLDATVGRDGRFAGRVRLAAGGWYTLELRPVAAGRAGPVAAVERVGVGEVFLVAGQSNASNFNERDPAYVVDDRVSTFGDNRWAIGGVPWPFQRGAPGREWEHAADPLRFSYGAGGNPWAYMANRLVRELGVPIGICPVAYPGSRVSNWLRGGESVPIFPGSRLHDHLIAMLVALGERGGLRAILWHQGETDRFTPAAEYARQLTELILQSRADSGVDVAWVIARASYMPGIPSLPFGADPCDPRYGPGSIRLAQCAVARSVPRCYPGPTTDDLGPPFRYFSHLNLRGLPIHGERWAEVLLGTPELMPPAPPPPGRPRPR